MKRISAATQISIGLVGLTLTLLFAAYFIGSAAGIAGADGAMTGALGTGCG